MADIRHVHPLLSPQRVFVYGFSAELPTSVYTLELLVLRGPALLQHQLLVFCRVSLPFADELPPSPYVLCISHYLSRVSIRRASAFWSAVNMDMPTMMPTHMSRRHA